MQKRKTGIVKASTTGIAMLLKSAGVTALQGHGKLLAGRKVEFTAHDGKTETLSAKHIVLASGSIPMELKSMPFDGKNIVDNWGALDFDAVPKKLAVVGAGVIGLELGSVWRRLGAEVVVLEALDTFLAVADQGLAKEAARHFKKQGLDIKLGAKVSGAKSTGSGVEVTYADASGSQTITVDKLIVCVGRRPFSKNLLGDGTGVQLDERGFIKVDDHCKTTAENIWAVGDCVRGPMLAHKAKDEGVMVGDLIAGRYGHMNYDTIPVGDLHASGDRLGGADRRAGEGQRPRLQDRPVPVRGQRSCACHGIDRRLREAHRGAGRRRNPGRAHHRSAGRRAHRRGRAGDGIFGEQ